MVPGNAYGTTKGGMRFLLRDIISNKTLFQRSDKPYVVMMGTNIIFNNIRNPDQHHHRGARELRCPDDRGVLQGHAQRR